MTIAAMLLPALLAGLVQGVTGFGAGVLLMLFYPLLFSVAQSSAMSQCLCTVLCLSVLLRYRRSIRFCHCILPLVFYFPFYFLALQQAASMDTDALKPVLGLFLVILSVFLLYGSDRIHIRAGVALLVGAALGGRVVDKIDTARMKICVYGFIGVAGLITIAANWQSLAALVG